ncbi:MAG: PDZ domain-containing protein, partial [Candidatus Eiseniibacteriota bacterium]
MAQAKELPNTSGALISRVESDSPASRAGIKRGDVIVEVDRNQIDDASELTRRVGDLEPGAKVQVIVLRDGMRKTLTVTAGKRPKEIVWAMPRRGAHWMQHMDGDMPMPPDLGEQLDRIREYRSDVQKQLTDIQEQLSRLREGDLQKLEDEIRALREELRARDMKKSD